MYSFDNYCCWSGTSIHSTYFANLYNVRGNAMYVQKPFWSFVNTMAFGAMRLPTQADIYFCVNTALSYGAKGIAEASTVALAPAITAALKQLCPSLQAVRLPLDREKILEALEASHTI
jgi:hypothetical protein